MLKSLATPYRILNNWLDVDGIFAIYLDVIFTIGILVPFCDLASL